MNKKNQIKSLKKQLRDLEQQMINLAPALVEYDRLQSKRQGLLMKINLCFGMNIVSSKEI